jgi:rhodanese-related sulfurtransferase
LVQEAKRRILETTPDVVRHRQQAGEEFLFIDVREDNEWQAGHAAGAIHLGKGIIERDIERLVPERDQEIILYCGGGYRSALAADALRHMGYTNVVSMDGGWKQWVAMGYPTQAG